MDYPPRVGKSERIYELWETGEGDMGELAIGLYDLTAHYKALWDEHEAIKQERDALVRKKIACIHCAREMFLTPDGQKLVEARKEIESDARID